jgi:hypothetical protein
VTHLIRQNRRLSVLVVAFALLGGLVAWRVSGTAQAHRAGTAQAHRAHNLTPRVLAGAGRRQARHFGLQSGQLRIQPGGRMLSAACFVIKGGFDGNPVLIVPVDSPRPALRDCRAVCPDWAPGKARALGLFGGGLREAVPAQPWHRFVQCGSLRLPPGYAVPLGY